MGPFNVTITVMVRKKVLSLNDYGPVTDPVTDPVTMLSQSSHGAYRASLSQTLPDAAPPIGKIHPFNKMTVTFEPMMRL